MLSHTKLSKACSRLNRIQIYRKSIKKNTTNVVIVITLFSLLSFFFFCSFILFLIFVYYYFYSNFWTHRRQSCHAWARECLSLSETILWCTIQKRPVETKIFFIHKKCSFKSKIETYIFKCLSYKSASHSSISKRNSIQENKNDSQ